MECIIKRILQFNSAVVYGPVVVIDDDNNIVTDRCMFSWSSDAVCWTSWVDYQNYQRICSNTEGEIYLRVLLTTTLKSISINGMMTECYSICLYDENPFIQDFCGTEMFNPYAGLDCALQLQQQLSDSVVCMLGIPVYYFRVSPDATSADYTFKEYVMHNVTAVKQLKLMISDGTMPSSKPQFTEMDFDWEVDWDTELSKRQFATAFGDDAFPKQRDMVYVPMMKRMWEVNSAYDEKNEGLMWQSTTWKLGLIKWNDKSNVITDDFDSLIDNLIVNTQDNVFNVLADAEQEKMTAATQANLPIHTANNVTNVFMYDYIRNTMTTDQIEIIDAQYNNRSAKITVNAYHLHDDAIITYQKGFCGESGIISFIIDTKGRDITTPKTLIKTNFIELILRDHLIDFDGVTTSISPVQSSQSTAFLVIASWDRATYVKQIVAYPYIVDPALPAYNIKPELCYFNFTVLPTVGVYNNDFISHTMDHMILQGSDVMVTNVKLYNTFLDNKQAIKESCKYTTKNPSCVINDVARPLDAGLGFAVK